MFWRKKSKTNSNQEKVINVLAKSIVRCQNVFGNTLNRKTSKWGTRHQKIFLASFLLIMIAVTLIQLLSKVPNLVNLPVQDGRERSMILPPQLTPKNPKTLSATDSLALVMFRLRLDQLLSTPAGRDSVRAFEKARPGFVDSVLRWEAEQILKP